MPIEDQDFVVTADPVGSASRQVTDAADDPLPGLLVTVTGPGGATYAVRTDLDGGWSLDGLPPGNYTATVTSAHAVGSDRDPRPPTPDDPDQPAAGPGDLADTGGPSGLLALLGLVLVAGGATVAGLSAGRAHRPGG